MERELGITEALNEAHDMRVNYLCQAALGPARERSALSTRNGLPFRREPRLSRAGEETALPAAERREHMDVSDFLLRALIPRSKPATPSRRQTSFSAQVERAPI
jgi:hypothetical protein